MAVTVTPLSGPLSSSKLVIDADTDETSESNVTGAGTTIYSVEVDNSANGAATYLKLYNNAAPSIGTTAPDMILLVPASVLRSFVFPAGIAFGTALSFAAVTAGGTAGVTGPTSAVTTRIVCT